MFYHSRELNHVNYGKVEGFVEEDDWLIPSYKWLGSYCGFYPQVWLSRSSSHITGKKFKKDGVLFGFDYIKGFSIDYSQWEIVINALVDRTNVRSLEKIIREYFRETNIEDDKGELKGEDRMFQVRDYEDWRDNYLFIENGQVVVPKLNLKSAKEIICNNEKQKRYLRKMGFINNRIKIMNFKPIIF